MSLAVCSIVKNEAPYIEEWIAFHEIQGVERFFIWDNGSTDGTWGILRKLQQKVSITLKQEIVNPIQFLAYNQCIANYGDGYDWMAFIDVDEFLYSPTEWKVSELLKEYEPYSAVAVHWYLYGSSDRSLRTDGLVTERFKLRAKEIDQHTKPIVKVEKALRVGKNPHYLEVNGPTVDENGFKLPHDFKGLKETGTAELLRINHYHTKSREEYFSRKKNNPDPGTGKFATNIEERFRAHDKNEVEDTTALKFVESVKKRIEEYHA